MNYHSPAPFARREMKEINLERSRLTLVPIPNSKDGAVAPACLPLPRGAIALLARQYDLADPMAAGRQLRRADACANACANARDYRFRAVAKDLPEMRRARPPPERAAAGRDRGG
jgi:hypothetical protein